MVVEAMSSRQFWYFDDITKYGRIEVLNNYVPTTLVTISILILLHNFFIRFYKYDIKKETPTPSLSLKLSSLNLSESDEEMPLTMHAQHNYGSHPSPSELNTDSSALYDRHFSINNIDSGEVNDPTKYHLIKRNMFEKFRVVIEFVIVAFQLLLHCYLSIEKSNLNGDLQKFHFKPHVLLWTILFTLATLRVLNLNQNNKFVNKYSGNIWLVSFANYTVIFLAHILPFRSALIGHVNDYGSSQYYKSQFWLNLVLMALLLTSPIGNNLPVLYQPQQDRAPSPEPYVSLLTFFSFHWVQPFINKAYKNNSLSHSDLWSLKLEDYSINVMKSFLEFRNRPSMRSSRFGISLLRYFLNLFMFQWCFTTISAFSIFVPTILLKKLLDFIEHKDEGSMNLAWFYVFGMFISRFIVAICDHCNLFLGRRVCVRMKSIIISEIYSKALKRKITKQSKPADENNENDMIKHDEVSPQEVNDTTHVNADEESYSSNLGSIINLMSVDAFKISELCAYLHYFLETAIMLTVSLILLYKVIGTAAFVGILITIIIIPINSKLYAVVGTLQAGNLACTDKRVEKLNESFQAIRIIKYFSWEDKFKEGIMLVREKELALLLKRCMVWCVLAFSWFITPTLITGCTFAYSILIEKKQLTTPVAFTALSLFTLLRDPLDRISDMLSYLIQSKISLDRVQRFLETEETDKYDQLTIDKNGKRLAFENVTLRWDSDKDSFVLRNLDIEFMTGKLNVIVGPTGSGKTSILMGLLGEMQLSEGKIIVPSLSPRHEYQSQAGVINDSIAYCSQAAWLLNDTVRNNILFNAPFDQARYDAVVEACSLKRDFQILKAGDSTEIGEKGITLSGGQKQRVSLARALYSSAGHLLLDDCLSAVDSHTALWIYDKCISGPLMEGRTCILVTHNIALTMKNADFVVMIEDGKVKEKGTPIELLAKGLLGEDENMKKSIISRSASSASLKGKSERSLGTTPAPVEIVQDSTPVKDDGKLIEEEGKAMGFVGKEIYKWYIKMYGGWYTIVALASVFTAILCLQITQAWWIRNWTVKRFSDVDESNYNLPASTFIVESRNRVLLSNEAGKKESENQNAGIAKFLVVYCLIGVMSSIIGSIKTFVNSLFGIRASKLIFDSLLDRVLHARVRFFDSTPIGRIMNRFSKDIESIDQEIPPNIQSVFYSAIEVFATLLLISYITPAFFPVAIIIVLGYSIVGFFYLTTSRELKRLDSISKSPIFQHFSETLVGVTTIRAFGDEQRFIKENLSMIDQNSMPFFYLWVVNRWLSFRIDLIGALVIFSSGVFILLNINNIDAGLAGISLTYAISFTEAALWLVRQYSELEMNMNSVERVLEYMNIEQEPLIADPANAVTPPPQWPDSGKVEVNNLSLKYAPHLPYVIKDVTFTIEPLEKVGIVGRTGAGKSTIITALFRFLEADTGSIKLDGVNIANIDLKRLRRSITIIPQDPTLFAGSIRSNLDPYDEYSDEEIFTALKRVNLVSTEEMEASTSEIQSNSSKNVNKFLNLESEIAEGGSNFSQGQRQLMCLARSLLRMPKVILLDEATASIDYNSDAKIQETIRQEFNNSTVLTIAHRLRSIVDYDKILVMDAGEVKEFDHPYSLLLEKKSIFYNMCEDSGELDVLIDLAKKSFISRLNSDSKK